MNELIQKFHEETGWSIAENIDDDGMYCWKDFGDMDVVFYVEKYKHPVIDDLEMLTLSVSVDKMNCQISLRGTYKEVKNAVLALNKLYRIKPIF